VSKESIWGSNAGPPVVWGLTLVFIFFEALFQLSDAGILQQDMRWQVYLRLAFFDLYFEGAREGASVPLQFWATFLTHAFLHGGLLHLFMNTGIFLALGSMLAKGLGTQQFLVLFTVSAIGGALLFALISNPQGPLVGASGALFGFIGALKRWEWRWIAATGASSQKFWGTILGLAGINVVLALTFQGAEIAWEAHLGGFIAGWLIAPMLAPGRAAPSPF
jgi:membrane associated rhomboid family serine protease